MPLVKPMRLTFAYHPVTDVRFGATTQLQGTTLEVSEAALRQYLLEDRRLERIDLAIVHPDESCRFGVAEDPDLIKRYRDAGVARLVFNLPPAQADEVLPLLDRCARLMQG